MRILSEVFTDWQFRWTSGTEVWLRMQWLCADLSTSLPLLCLSMVCFTPLIALFASHISRALSLFFIWKMEHYFYLWAHFTWWKFGVRLIRSTDKANQWSVHFVDHCFWSGICQSPIFDHFEMQFGENSLTRVHSPTLLNYTKKSLRCVLHCFELPIDSNFSYFQ